MKVLSLRDKPRRLSLKQSTELLLEALCRFEKENPTPHCELYYETPYQLLVSVVLSAQTTDKSVNKCMEPLYKAGFNPEHVLQWKEEGFYQHIKSIGLARTKAKHVYKLTQILTSKEKSKYFVPDNREELEALPGVGRKTASVVLGELYKQPTLAIDTHVFRVSKRLALQNEKTPQAAEKVLLKIIPSHYLPRAHHWFVLHGRYVCKAIRPLCEQCVLNDLCPSVDLKQ